MLGIPGCRATVIIIRYLVTLGSWSPVFAYVAYPGNAISEVIFGHDSDVSHSDIMCIVTYFTSVATLALSIENTL